VIKIVNAKEDDMSRILEIEQESISPPWTHGSLLCEIFKEDTFFATAVEDGKTLGFVILRRMPDDGELLQIAVDSAGRRRGIADLLMIAALDNAKENALKSVFLEVRKSNNAAICLYEKHGFKSLRQRRDYYNDPTEDAIVMVRSI